MRKQSLALLACVVIMITLCKANAEVAGGIVLGSPSAFTLRIDNTVVLGIGGWGGGMILYADHWIIHKPIPSSSIPLYWYLGIGGEFGVWNDWNGYWGPYYYNNYDGGFFLGARIPIGLQLPFEQRWEAFVEVVPVMMVFPFGPTANAGIGIRYTF